MNRNGTQQTPDPTVPQSSTAGATVPILAPARPTPATYRRALADYSRRALATLATRPPDHLLAHAIQAPPGWPETLYRAHQAVIALRAAWGELAIAAQAATPATPREPGDRPALDDLAILAACLYYATEGYVSDVLAARGAAPTAGADLQAEGEAAGAAERQAEGGNQ